MVVFTPNTEPNASTTWSSSSFSLCSTLAHKSCFSCWCHMHFLSFVLVAVLLVCRPQKSLATIRLLGSQSKQWTLESLPSQGRKVLMLTSTISLTSFPVNVLDNNHLNSPHSMPMMWHQMEEAILSLVSSSAIRNRWLLALPVC